MGACYFNNCVLFFGIDGKDEVFSWELSLNNVVFTVSENFYHLPAALSDMYTDAIGILGLLSWYQRALDISKKQNEELGKIKAGTGRRR